MCAAAAAVAFETAASLSMHDLPRANTGGETRFPIVLGLSNAAEDGGSLSKNENENHSFIHSNTCLNSTRKPSQSPINNVLIKVS